MVRLELIPYTIIACCVPHNICLRSIDDDIEVYILDGAEIENNEVQEPPEINDPAEAEGMSKRDYIAARL